MKWSDIPFDPQRKVLRQFAALWLVFFGGLACWQYLAEGRAVTAAVLATLAVTIGPIGLIEPRLVRPIFVSWMVLAFPIGWFVSHAALAAMFYGIFAPVAVVFRLVGRDALRLRRQPHRSTHWEPKVTPSDPRTYLRQF